MIFYPEEVCGRVLFELSPKAESVKASRELFESCDELKDALASPAVEIKEKEKVIDRLFPEDMRNFLKSIVFHNFLLAIFLLSHTSHQHNFIYETLFKCFECIVQHRFSL